MQLESVDHCEARSRCPAFVDLVGLWSDWLPLPHSSISTVLSPIGPEHYPMIETRALRVVLYRYLQERQKKSFVSPQLSRVLTYYNAWASEKDRFYDFYKLVGNRPEDVAHRHFLETIYHDTTQYFAHLELKHGPVNSALSNTTSWGRNTKDNEHQEGLEATKKGSKQYFSGLERMYGATAVVGPVLESGIVPFMMQDPTVSFSKQNRRVSGSRRTFYAQLVCAHVDVNALSLREADARLAAGQKRNGGCLLPHDLWAERTFIYADNVPLVVDDMKRRGFSTADVEDAWWTLMLRGQCWAMSNSRVGVKYGELPSHYYGSPTKVYIL